MAKRNENTIETIPLTAPIDVVDSLTPIYEQFIKAIEGGELYIKPEECLRVLKVMEAAFISAENDTAVKTDILIKACENTGFYLQVMLDSMQAIFAFKFHKYML